VPNVETAHKVHELNIKRPLQIEYLDAEGNPLKEEPISLHFPEMNAMTVMLDESGKATVPQAPLGPFRAEQPDRK
jgi:hypothetical protein